MNMMNSAFGELGRIDLDSDINFIIADFIINNFTPKVTEMETARLKLCLDYAEKDKAGKPKQDNKKTFQILPEKKVEFDAEIAKLEVELNFTPIKREVFKGRKTPLNLIVALVRLGIVE